MIRTKHLQRSLLVALLGTTLSACGSSIVGTPTTHQPAASQPAGSADPIASGPAGSISPATGPVPTVVAPQPVAKPVLGFEPKAGAPGTNVSVWGSGYAPSKPVVIRIGLPQATGEVLASAVADGQGSWKASLVIPDRLPSGDVITADTVRLVAMNDQNVALASAPFGFTPLAPAGPSRDAAPQAVKDLLNNFGSGNVAPYVAPVVRKEMAAGRPVHEILGLAPMAWRSFAVFAPEDNPSEVLFVPATLQYATYEEDRVFELVVEGNQWKVQHSSRRAVRTTDHSNGGSSDPTAGYEIATSGDWNGDGIKEALYYRPVKITPHTIFDDGPHATVIVTSEAFIAQDEGHGPAQLFWVTPQDVRSSTPLIMFETYGSPGIPTAFLIALNPSIDPLISILPLNRDGSVHDELIGLNWSVEQSAYWLTRSLNASQ